MAPFPLQMQGAAGGTGARFYDAHRVGRPAPDGLAVIYQNPE